MKKHAVALASLLLAGCSGASAGDGEPPAPAEAAGVAEIDALLVARRYRAALAEIDARLPQAPGNLELLDLRVRALRELGLVQEALAQVLALRELAPGEARYAYEAGELAGHLAAGADKKLAAQRIAQAREQFAAARHLAPDDWRPAVAEAALLLQGKAPDLAAADALLAPWLEGPRAQADARVLHAHVLEAGGDPQGALAAFEQALALEPGRVDALCNAARLAEAGHERERALAYLRRAKADAGRGDPALARELDQRIAELSK